MSEYTTKEADCQIGGLSFLLADTEPHKPLVIAGIDWPCGSAIIYREKTTRPMLCGKLSCDSCRWYKARRLARQILHENGRVLARGRLGLRLKTIGQDEWEAMRKDLKRLRRAFKTFPRANGKLLVIGAFNGGEPLPSTDEYELTVFLDQVLVEIPEGKKKRRVSGSRGFGGGWSKASQGNDGWSRSSKDWESHKAEVVGKAKERLAQTKDILEEVEVGDVRGQMDLSSLTEQEFMDVTT